MRNQIAVSRVATTLAAGLLAGLLVGGPSASAQPEIAPPPADPQIPMVAVAGDAPAPPIPPDPLAAALPAPDPAAALPAGIPQGPPAGQNPMPFTGEPPFRPPSFNPVNGAMVGVAKPISINFQRPIADRAMAENAVHISSSPPVPGKFYWMSDTQLRWRPIDFWPANATVHIDAAGTKSSFRTGEALVATVDNTTHQMTVMRNGKLEKTFPVSLGKPGWETPNGTYYVLEKFADIVMDSSTFGLRIDSPEGYRLDVKDAVRISNDGIFVHSAPWSVGDQGSRNVSHGCINLSPANAQWFYDNFGSGDPVVVKNSTGTYIQNDGAQDWQL
ncbi:MAG: L,D-transpeptidase family protein [Mycolicibacterium sp.]|uniref:L,D-transpeptidase n=1 Tax=Mycolicibacterium sp. TaxID=2320850 RepID=UPI003D0A2006